MTAEDQEQRFSCRFCNKNFSNGRSLGGHMRGHLALIYAEKCEEDDNGDVGFEGEDFQKVPLSSEMDLDDAGEVSYGLRENPKKSWRISDGDFKEINVCKECGKGFCSPKALAGHTRTHSAKRKKGRNAICNQCGKEFDSMRALFGHMRCHPKRSRVSNESDYEVACPVKKKRSRTRYNTTTSHASDSYSESFTEVDEVKEVAMCLMMLSRGVRSWDEFSLIIDTAKFSSSGDFESCRSFRGQGFSGKQDDLRSDCGGNVIRKMKKPGGNIESSVSGFGNFVTCFAVVDEQKSEFDVSYDQSLGCDKFKNTADMKKGISSTTELELKDLLTEVGLEQVDMGLPKANSNNKANFVDDQIELKGNAGADQLQCATGASEFLKDHEREGKFKCKTCGKTFANPQALGGHQTSHRKVDSCITLKEESCRYMETDSELQKLKHNEKSLEHDDLKRSKEYECSVCFKVFASGRALGGHKRAHYVGLIESRGKENMLMEQELPDQIDNNLDHNFAANVEEESVIGVGSKPWWGVNDFQCEPLAIIN